MTKHTKGNWIAKQVDLHKSLKSFRVYSGTKIICDLRNYDRYNPEANIEEKANAELIALAGNLAQKYNLEAYEDLLKACQEFVRKVECGEARSKRSYEQMKQAIKKATA